MCVHTNTFVYVRVYACLCVGICDHDDDDDAEAIDDDDGWDDDDDDDEDAYVCMYVCLYTYVCMYVRMSLTYGCVYVSAYVCLYVCMRSILQSDRLQLTFPRAAPSADEACELCTRRTVQHHLVTKRAVQHRSLSELITAALVFVGSFLPDQHALMNACACVRT